MNPIFSFLIFARCLSLYSRIGEPFNCTVPRVGTSRRPMTLSSVLLPHPEGPIMLTNSPSAISRLMLLSATVSILSVR